MTVVYSKLLTHFLTHLHVMYNYTLHNPESIEYFTYFNIPLDTLATYIQASHCYCKLSLALSAVRVFKIKNKFS